MIALFKILIWVMLALFAAGMLAVLVAVTTYVIRGHSFSTTPRQPETNNQRLSATAPTSPVVDSFATAAAAYLPARTHAVAPHLPAGLPSTMRTLPRAKQYGAWTAPTLPAGSKTSSSRAGRTPALATLCRAGEHASRAAAANCGTLSTA